LITFVYTSLKVGPLPASPPLPLEEDEDEEEDDVVPLLLLEHATAIAAMHATPNRVKARMGRLLEFEAVIRA
jgi:hypothetical protein